MPPIPPKANTFSGLTDNHAEVKEVEGLFADPEVKETLSEVSGGFPPPPAIAEEGASPAGPATAPASVQEAEPGSDVPEPRLAEAPSASVKRSTIPSEDTLDADPSAPGADDKKSTEEPDKKGEINAGKGLMGKLTDPATLMGGGLLALILGALMGPLGAVLGFIIGGLGASMLTGNSPFAESSAEVTVRKGDNKIPVLKEGIEGTKRTIKIQLDDGSTITAHGEVKGDKFEMTDFTQTTGDKTKKGIRQNNYEFPESFDITGDSIDKKTFVDKVKETEEIKPPAPTAKPKVEPPEIKRDKIAAGGKGVPRVSRRVTRSESPVTTATSEQSSAIGGDSTTSIATAMATAATITTTTMTGTGDAPAAEDVDPIKSITSITEGQPLGAEDRKKVGLPPLKDKKGETGQPTIDVELMTESGEIKTLKLVVKPKGHGFQVIAAIDESKKPREFQRFKEGEFVVSGVSDGRFGPAQGEQLDRQIRKMRTLDNEDKLVPLFNNAMGLSAPLIEVKPKSKAPAKKSKETSAITPSSEESVSVTVTEASIPVDAGTGYKVIFEDNNKNQYALLARVDQAKDGVVTMDTVMIGGTLGKFPEGGGITFKMAVLLI